MTYTQLNSHLALGKNKLSNNFCLGQTESVSKCNTIINYHTISYVSVVTVKTKCEEKIMISTYLLFKEMENGAEFRQQKLDPLLNGWKRWYLHKLCKICISSWSLYIGKCSSPMFTRFFFILKGYRNPRLYAVDRYGRIFNLHCLCGHRNLTINILRPRQNSRKFSDEIFIVLQYLFYIDVVLKLSIQMHFPEWKIYIFWLKCHWSLFPGQMNNI